MKFMKLGSKPDSFQTDGDNIRLFRVNVFLEKPHLHRYVATELANDIVINVGDVKFYLHKFPLLSKSARLQKLVATINEENSDEIHIHDIPGGPAAFEMCAKFCYGMIVTLNAYNVVAARCAAEYLEMYENIEKGNLVYKIEVFLNSSVFRSWKDSIIVLQTTKSFIPWSEELKMVSHALDSIATKASMDPSKVEWSYTYNRKKLPSENGNDMHWNNVKKYQMIPKDWWVEDLCDLHIDLYRRVITTIKTKEKISGDIIGEALNAYALRRLPGFRENTVQVGDIAKDRSYVETIVWLLPKERGSVPCSFLLRMLRAAILSECAEMVRRELMKRIGQQLEEAAVDDLLIRYPVRGTTIYDVDIVQSLVEEFMVHEQNINNDSPVQDEFQDTRSLRFVSDASKVMVAKLVDGYLAEIARDPNLPLSKFVDLAEMVSGFSRSSHDELYRAIDMYLKEHTGISKSEKKRICRLMDCRKLSVEACMHVVQNERLPLRVVVQVLFFEQIRATTSSAGNSTPDVPSSGSNGSSRSTTTNTEEEWDTVPTAEDIKALKGEFATLKNDGAKDNADKVASRKMKGLLMSKMFSKLWSSRDRHVEISSSDTSESPGSRSRSHSVS